MVSSRHNMEYLKLRSTRKLEASAHNTDCNAQTLSESLDLEILTRGLGGCQECVQSSMAISLFHGRFQPCRPLNGPATRVPLLPGLPALHAVPHSRLASQDLYFLLRDLDCPQPRTAWYLTGGSRLRKALEDFVVDIALSVLAF